MVRMRIDIGPGVEVNFTVPEDGGPRNMSLIHRDVLLSGTGGEVDQVDGRRNRRVFGHGVCQVAHDTLAMPWMMAYTQNLIITYLQ